MVIHYKKLLDYPQIKLPTPSDIYNNIPHNLGCSEDIVLHESCLDCPFHDRNYASCGLSTQNYTQVNKALVKLLNKHPEIFV